MSVEQLECHANVDGSSAVHSSGLVTVEIIIVFGISFIGNNILIAILMDGCLFVMPIWYTWRIGTALKHATQDQVCCLFDVHFLLHK